MARASTAIELVCGAARAAIATHGAQALTWRAGGVDLLWTPDPAIWDETAPVLFPVCGWTRNGEVRISGKTYPLGLHGFARFEDFELVERRPDFVRLVLCDNARTRAQYPYSFELSISYRLREAALEIETYVNNSGERTMPYAFGLHPGFRWPFVSGAMQKDDIQFDEVERQDIPMIAPGGLFSKRTRPVVLEGGRRLTLTPQTFESEALCFLDCASRGLEWRGPGGQSLRVAMEGFRHLVLWSRPGAPFLCIETWTGYGDPEDFVEDLAQKPSMIHLSPGERRRHAATWSVKL